VALGFGALIFASARARAEDPAATPAGKDAPQEIFFDAIDLTVVNIEVYVTDKKGQPVHGLTRDDFEIYEDGRRIPVSNFYAVAAGRVQALETLRPMDVAPSGPAATLDEIEIPEQQRLTLIVYVDNLFIQPFNRNRVLRQAVGFLRSVLHGGDRAMVVSFDRALHLRQPLTADHRLVESALLDLEEQTGWGVQAQTERRDVIRRLDQVRDSFEAEGHVESYANARFFEVRQTVKALEEQVEALAGLPGRKAVLYVSDGFPMTTAEDLYYLLDLRYPDRTGGELAAARFRARRLIRNLTFDANTNRVTFYTLQAKGLTSHGSLSAESRSNDGSLIEIETVYDASHEASLEMMARDTGGLAALGTNNIDGALERVAEDFANYYSLGYVPTHDVAGRYHRVEIKVGRKGLTVRHRDGYRDKPPKERLSEATLAALRFGLGDNALGLRIVAGQPHADDDGRYLVPIEVRIPIGALALLPREQVHQGKLRVSVAVKDDDGAVSPVTVTPLDLAIPDAEIDTAREKNYVFAVELRMKRGIHRLAIGVHDDLAGETSFVGGAVDVGS